MTSSFGSDNHSGVHPAMWQALAEANTGHTPSYGTDPWCERASHLFREHFGPDVQTYFVFNGTGANVLALAGLVNSYESVLTTAIAHLNVDECAAPEITGRFKLLTVNSDKLTPQDIEDHFVRRGDQHAAQLRAISLTQPTEAGTLYSRAEMQVLIEAAHRRGLFVHIDGARLILAAERLGCSLGELVQGADVVSFGGTKNGLMMGEAVLVFQAKLNDRYKYLRKQMMQLPSKSRFIGAQFTALLTHNLWREIAHHSCKMAQQLAQGLGEIATVQLSRPVQSNAVFAVLPKHYVSFLREKYFFYVWNEHTFEVRLMTTFDTTKADVDGFLNLVRELAANDIQPVKGDA